MLADSHGDNAHSVNYADAALEHCDVSRAFHEALHVLPAEAHAVSLFTGELQMGR